ncbi:hypothetical protein Tco_1570593 [Tanacetum coccineum]|uniref:Uncharacterized protein n=1 Tax=Tanacetum coccineum TaxID=301880 RepID=A0ABQ5F8I6_9ASTR
MSLYSRTSLRLCSVEYIVMPRCTDTVGLAYADLRYLCSKISCVDYKSDSRVTLSHLRNYTCICRLLCKDVMIVLDWEDVEFFIDERDGMGMWRVSCSSWGRWFLADGGAVEWGGGVRLLLGESVRGWVYECGGGGVKSGEVCGMSGVLSMRVCGWVWCGVGGDGESIVSGGCGGRLVGGRWKG